MQKPFWRDNLDLARYGLTGFRLQALACLVVTISLGFLLRLSTIAWGVSARCVEADQFWFESYKYEWPLGGVFFFVFFLLLIWNGSIFLNQVSRRKSDLFLTGLNFVAIVVIFSIANPAFDEASLEYDTRMQKHDGWIISNTNLFYWEENRCDLAAPYVGRWNVIELELPKYGVDFPKHWIDMKQTFEIEAANSARGKVLDGHWSPPSFSEELRNDYRQVGIVHWNEGWSYWRFDLDGDTLTLTTADFVDWHLPARVVLHREGE